MAIHRRELLLVGAGLVAAKATATTLACAKETKVEEDEKAAPAKTPEAKTAGAKAPDAKADPHAGHEGHEGHAADAGAGAPANAAFAAALADCTERGEACLQHCIALLSTGDTSMAECASAVNEMLAICRGMGVLAVSNSKHLAAAAKVCHSLCSDCAAACKPHAGHHATCKACAEACEATMAEASKIG